MSLDQSFCLFSLDIADNHQAGITGAIPVLAPVSEVFEGQSFKIVGNRFPGPVVTMPGGYQCVDFRTETDWRYEQGLFLVAQKFLVQTGAQQFIR
ncbi:hypothetical protein D3C79_1004500 [compost metagenome]